MPIVEHDPNSVLILAPTGQDASLIRGVLSKESLICEICHNPETVCSRMDKDFGAIILAEEALDKISMGMFREKLEAQEPWSDAPLIVMTSGGETTLVSMRVMKEFSPAGNVTLLERPFRPITLLSAVHVALRARKRQFQVRELMQRQIEATQMRDDFISIASHELKTPLTSLKLQTQINQRLMKNETGEINHQRVHKLVENTNRQVDRLSRLVEDMLDVSRINAGKLALDTTEVNPAELVTEIVERLQPQLSAAGCEMQMEMDDSIRGSWDRYRIEQVIINLLTNAIRYAPGKPVLVSISRILNKMHLEVCDQGNGIEEKDREKIFHRFERIPNSRGIDGLGLGLYICQQIVKAHGGSIRVGEKRAMSSGACFVVELPI